MNLRCVTREDNIIYGVARRQVGAYRCHEPGQVMRVYYSIVSRLFSHVSKRASPAPPAPPSVPAMVYIYGISVAALLCSSLTAHAAANR